MKKLKQIVSMILVFLTVFSTFSILPSEVFHSMYVSAAELVTDTVSAEPTYTTDDGFSYKYTNSGETVEILGYSGTEKNIIIPDRIDEKQVTSIANSAFANKKITSVVIGVFVKTIGNSAFSGCTSLTEVQMGSYVTNIGSSAFYNCNALTNVEFGSNLETIGNDAFQYCNALTEVTINSPISSIGSWSFHNCTNLQSINITSTAENGCTVGSEAFYNCDNLKEVILGIGITRLNSYVFENCDKLETVTLSSDLTTIDNYAFQYCPKISSIVIPNSVKTIGTYAFRNCTGLESVTLSENLTSLSARAFLSCTNLKNIVIPNSVASIGDSAFESCTALSTVTIGSGCTSISASAFLNDTAITEFSVNENNTTYTSENGIIYNKDKTSIVFYPNSREGAFTVPNTITSISANAFRRCPNLTEVVIGENVTSIGNAAFYDSDALTKVTFIDSKTNQANRTIVDSAFAYCNNLAEVNLGNAVTVINGSAFRDCPKLTTVNLGSALKTIGGSAFYNCYALTNVNFGSNLETIGNDAFQYCNALTEVTINSSISSIGSWAFHNCTNLQSVNITSTANNGCTIGSYAFYDCNNLTDVTIGTGVKNTGYEAFYSCDKLETVNLSNDVTTIDNYAFEYCPKISSIVIPNSVKTIGTSAFRNCTGLESVTLSENLTSIPSNTFYNCTKLSNIVIPDSVTSVGDSAFENCTSLSTVTIGSGCTSISASAFLNDTALTNFSVSKDNTVYSSSEGALLDKAQTTIIFYPNSREGSFTVPDTVNSISANAFRRCPNLTEVVIGEGVTSIGNNAFYDSDALTKVTFKDSKTNQASRTIGDSAFAYCNNLAEVNLGNAVTVIKGSAFRDCPKLTTVNLGSALKTIGGYAFYNCYALTNVNFGSNLETIGEDAFEYCNALTEVTINSPISSIGSWAFNYCTNLQSVNITSTANNGCTIGSYAFRDCNNLTDVTIGTGVKNTGYEAFYSCDKLETVTLSNDLTTIDNYAFQYCPKISSIVIPNSVKTIGTYAFRNCTGLESVTLSENLTSLSARAFLSCTNLKNIVIPNSVTSIGDSAFESCTALSTVTIGSGCTSISASAFLNDTAITEFSVNENNTTYTSENGIIYNKDKTSIVFYPNSREGAFTVPNTVTSISANAFRRCPNLTEVVIGENVTSIGNAAFYDSDALTKATFKDSKTNQASRTIGDSAFAYCNNLAEVNLGNAVTVIKGSAFRDCPKLTTVNLGSALKTIGGYAFYNCYALTNVNFGSNLETIGEDAFEYCNALTEVTINSPISSIGSWAFNNCKDLQSVNITSTANNGCTIGSYAFRYCDNLKEVILGTGVKNTGYEAFYSCDKLETVNLSNDVTTIDNYAFEYCPKLSSIVLGSGIESIGSNAFYGHNALTVICFENSYAHKYAQGLGDNVTIKFVMDNYYVVDLKVAELSKAGATITWQKPNGFDNIDHYIISKNGTANYDTTTSLSYTDTNLKTGTEYTYGVIAVDSEGNISEEKTVSVTPAISTISEITVPNAKIVNDELKIGGNTSFKLIAIMGDNLAKTGATGKFLYSTDGKKWKNACVATIEKNNKNYVGYWDLENIESGDYTVRFVFTDKDGGQSYKDIAVNVDRTHPAKIDEFRATSSAEKITLAWVRAVESDTKYRIYRKVSNDEKFEVLTEVNPTENSIVSYVDTKTLENVVYEYYIVGVDEFNQESLEYTIVSAGRIDDTIAPVFESISPKKGSIYRKYNFTVTGSDNLSITKIELYYTIKSNPKETDWILLDSQNGTKFSKAVDTSVMPDGSVYIRAKLYDAAGNTTFSPTYNYQSDNTGPDKVKNVKAVSENDSTIITLSWDNVQAKDIRRYEVEQKNADGTFKSVATLYSTIGANINYLAPETTYTFRVVGYDQNGNRGIESDEVTCTTGKDYVVPVISSMSPAPGYYKASIPLSITATDNYQVKSITIQTSYDKQKWKTVTTINASNLNRSFYTSYSLDLTNYEEGTIYVRAFATDTKGNVTTENKRTTYEYVVDKTPCEVPTNVVAEAGETEASGNSVATPFVCISWSNIYGDQSLASFTVYKSESEKGNYTKLVENLKTVNHYDSAVEYGKTYYYKVVSVDKAGNISDYSSVAYCTVKGDDVLPQIYSISPENGSLIGTNYCTVKYAAYDNAKISTLKIEYKVGSGEYKTLKITNNNAKQCTESAVIPVTEIKNGSKVTVKVTAKDSAGNEAEPKTATYTVDNVAPTVTNVKLTRGESNFALEWKTNGAKDTKVFQIYRQRATDKDYVFYDVVNPNFTSNTYTYYDDQVVATDKSVKYKVVAYDNIGNSAFAESNKVEFSYEEYNQAPKAVLNCQSVFVIGSEYKFDASSSTDDGQIKSYKFDFGNGDTLTSTTGIVKYTYKTTGSFQIKLTVTDELGKSTTITKDVSVNSRNLLSTLTVTVVDDKGAKLANTPVYIDLNEDGEQIANTNSNGVATFEVKLGSHVVASYKDQYLPVKQDIIVSGSTEQVKLVLINQPIVTGTFEIHEMTFEEIVAAGINVNAAENRNVVRIDVKIYYEKKQVSSVVYWNGSSIKAEPVYINTSVGKRVLYPCVINYGSGSTGTGGNVGQQIEPTLVYIDIPVNFSYLKQFFNVTLHIMNNASEEFTLTDNKVTLNVPDGLTLMKETRTSEHSEVVYVDEIKGQEQKDITWILRGDEPGEYEISADYQGILSYFNEPVTAKFMADDKIKVNDASVITVDIDAAEESENGDVYYNVTVKNTSQTTVNDFVWEGNTPYLAEYISADGERFKLENIQSKFNLEPGEQYIYHYVEHFDMELNYHHYLVERYNKLSESVKLNINIRPVSYFKTIYDSVVYSEVLSGDINFDKVIDIDDVTELQLYVGHFKEMDEKTKKAADIDMDGEINISDVTMIQSFILTDFKNSGYCGKILKSNKTYAPYYSVILGDVNRDRKINGEDVKLIEQYRAKTITFNRYEFFAADVNKDGVVNSVDQNIIVKYINGDTTSEVSKSYTNLYVKNNVLVIGDVNSDDSINIEDALLIAKYNKSMITLSQNQMITADVNGDGQVNDDDYFMLKSYVYKTLTETSNCGNIVRIDL